MVHVDVRSQQFFRPRCERPKCWYLHKVVAKMLESSYVFTICKNRMWSEVSSQLLHMTNTIAKRVLKALLFCICVYIKCAVNFETLHRVCASTHAMDVESTVLSTIKCKCSNHSSKCCQKIRNLGPHQKPKQDGAHQPECKHDRKTTYVQVTRL